MENSSQLIQTKLYRPRIPTDFVARTRLFDQLDSSRGSTHTLVAAPAGYGKSTLLASWLDQVDCPNTWLSLDKGDNNLVQFLAYLVAALQTIEGNVGQGLLAALQTPGAVNVEAVLTAMVNDIAGLPDSLILVLDDYHVIEAQPIHDVLTFLLDHLPRQMHLIIAGRSDPPLPLSRLRGRGQLTELRAENLRFTTQEAIRFLNQVMELALSEDEVLSLENRTEGWFAGFNLAALSMQDTEDVEGFIAAFNGDDRYIVDYLVDEVLTKRPIGTKDFLLRTSMIGRMSGSLYNALTSQEGGQVMLEKLDQANLFIVLLDNKRNWYRYLWICLYSCSILHIIIHIGSIHDEAKEVRCRRENTNPLWSNVRSAE